MMLQLISVFFLGDAVIFDFLITFSNWTLLISGQQRSDSQLHKQEIVLRELLLSDYPQYL